MSNFTQERFTLGGTHLSSLHHLTIDTGHSLTTPGSVVPSPIRDLLKGVLKFGEIASIGGGLAARVDAIPRGWRFDLFQDRAGSPPLVSCYVAGPTGGGAVWATLCRDREILKCSEPKMPRPSQEVWLAVFFRPGIFMEDATTQAILGDAERCIAWTLLAHFRPGATDASASPPTPDGCVDERALTCSALASLVFGGKGRGARRAPRKRSLPGGTLASGVVADAAGLPENDQAHELAYLIQQAGRLELDEEVVKAADDLGGMLPDLLKWYRLPFEPTWLEWVHRQPADLRDVDPDGQPLRCGVLIWRNSRGRVLMQGALAYPGGTGITEVVAPEAEDLAGDLREMVVAALRMLVVITAKRTPVIIGVPAQDYGRLNRQRIRKGQSPLMTLRPVRWALTRGRPTAGDSGGIDKSRKLRAHLQRGHFKTCKTGVFWWGPHWRGWDDAEPCPPSGRDHQVRK